MRHSSWLMVAWAVLAASAVKAAGPSGAPPLDAFFAGTRVQDVAVSPDGRYLSMIAVQEGHALVVVQDRAHPDSIKRVAAAGDRDSFRPAWCGWANPTRLLCGFAGLGAVTGKSYQTSRLVAVNADGSDLRVLTNRNRPQSSQFEDRILDWTPEDPRTVLVETDEDDNNSSIDGRPDVYAVDVYTGSRRRVMREHAGISHFVTDGHGNIRLGYGYRGDEILHFARLNDETQWRELSRVKVFDSKARFTPVAVIAGTNLAYASGEHEGREAIWKIDLEDEADPQLLYSHPQVDVDDPIFTDDGRLIGIRYEAERPSAFYSDAQAATAYAVLQKALPGRTVAIVDMTPDGKVLVARAARDTAPPTYLLLDLRGSIPVLDVIAQNTPGLTGYALSPMLSISFPARDGTTIPGYLTQPVKAARPGRPPLIVLPHGGPQARDSWGFDAWVQFLASQGYAVLQIEFRGSTGYGTEWWRAGFRDWGGLPYDDVVDGTRWALEQGYGDPARVCIVGGSYGGYLAQIAATRNTDHLFRCAVSIAGVSDLVELRSDQHFFRHWEVATASLAQDSKKLKEDSPRNHAAQVNVPMLLVHGDRDYTVEVDHTKLMNAALTRAGKAHETVIIERADHYFREDAQLRKLFTSMGDFLSRQFGDASSAR